MAQPFGVGDVVGGRYRITHHVVTSADQDVVFQATDEVLDREVSVLLAARSNAKQVATSAKELATGERSSEVQVLDLGLAQERTYLISSLVDPNQLLDLVVPDAAPYVEPYFTDSLGSELFGQSREMEPQTYDDDAEYYAQLQAGLDPAQETSQPAGRFARRRPAFLDKVKAASQEDQDAESAARAGQPADLQNAVESAGQDLGVEPGGGAFGLHSDLAEVAADPSADTQETIEAARSVLPAEDFEAAGPPAPVDSGPESSVAETDESDADYAPEESYGPVTERDPSAAISTVSVGPLAAQQQPTKVDQIIAEGEEVIDNPPESPEPSYDRRTATEFGEPASTPAAESYPDHAPAPDGERPGSFTGLISAVPAATRSPFPAGDSPDRETAPAPAADDEAEQKPALGGWIAAAVLAAVVLAAAVVIFLALRSGNEPDAAPAAPEQTQEQQEPTPEQTAEDDAAAAETGETEPSPEETGPAPAVATVTREVPESPGLNAAADGQLSNLIDGSADSAWATQSFATANFGGFASAMNVVLELEEPAQVSEVSVQAQGEYEGGSFEVLLSDSANVSGASSIGTGDFSDQQASVSTEPTEAAFVIIQITELPQEVSPTVAGMPFRLQLGEIDVS